MDWYKRYMGDYMRDTGSLTFEQHGAYNLMMDQLYATEKPLPVGDELYRLVRACTTSERKAVDFVAAQFFKKSSSGLAHKRINEEIAKATKRREANKANGLKGGRPNETEE